MKSSTQHPLIPGSFAERLHMALHRMQAGRWTEEDERIVEHANNGGRGWQRGSNPEALAKYAAILDGEIDAAGYVVAARVKVRINPDLPKWFFIYEHDFETDGAAYAWVRKKLGLIDAVRTDPAVRTAQAKYFWDDSRPAGGTLVEAYLRSRSISGPVPPILRFHPRLLHSPTRTYHPAMVALVTDAEDQPLAIHRTYLKRDGSGKAEVDPNKMSLGPIAGGAVRLAHFMPERRVMVGEGIETCLSAMSNGGQAWSAISAPNLKKTLVLPSMVSAVMILADNDPAGEAAVLSAAKRWRREGRAVVIARPPLPFNDFNDLLTGHAEATT